MAFINFPTVLNHLGRHHDRVRLSFLPLLNVPIVGRSWIIRMILLFVGLCFLSFGWLLFQEHYQPMNQAQYTVISHAHSSSVVDSHHRNQDDCQEEDIDSKETRKEQEMLPPLFTDVTVTLMNHHTHPCPTPIMILQSPQRTRSILSLFLYFHKNNKKETQQEKQGNDAFLVSRDTQHVYPTASENQKKHKKKIKTNIIPLDKCTDKMARFYLNSMSTSLKSSSFPYFLIPYLDVKVGSVLFLFDFSIDCMF